MNNDTAITNVIFGFVGMLVGAALAVSLLHPKTVYIPSNRTWLADGIVNATSAVVSGTIIGDIRQTLASKLIGAAPFLANAEIDGGCVIVSGGDAKRFYEAGGLFRNVSVNGSKCSAAVTFLGTGAPKIIITMPHSPVAP